MRILGQKGVKKWAGKIHQKLWGNPFRNFSKSSDFLKIFWKFSEIFWNEQILGCPNWHWVRDLPEISHPVSVWAKISKKFQKIPKMKIFGKFSKFWKMLKIWFFQFFFKNLRKLKNQLFCRNPQSIWHFSGPIGRPADQPETSPKRRPKMAD